MSGWLTDRPFKNLGNSELNWNLFDRFMNPVYIEIDDTGTAGSVNTVRHGLGRIPRKCVVVRAEIASGSGPASVTVYQETGDADWTLRELTVRCSVANAHVVLEIV